MAIIAIIYLMPKSNVLRALANRHTSTSSLGDSSLVYKAARRRRAHYRGLVLGLLIPLPEPLLETQGDSAGDRKHVLVRRQDQWRGRVA